MNLVVTHKVSVDLEGKGELQWIEVKQWDAYTRQIRAFLFEGKQTWKIPDGVSVILYAQKPDGTGCTYDTMPNGERAWSAEENVLTLMLAPQILTAVGNVSLYVRIQRNQEVLNAFQLEVRVSPVEQGENGGAASGDYINLTGFLPAPDQAAAGQYIRIAEVDAGGKVLRVESAEMTGSGGVDEDAVREWIEDYLSEQETDKRELSLGIGDDGLVYLFVDGVAQGSGLDIQTGTVTGDVTGYVDGDNNIILTGTLADGTYTFKYEKDDGGSVVIGSVVVGDESGGSDGRPIGIDLIPLAIQKDGTPYKGDNNEAGYRVGYRLTTAGVESANDLLSCTGFIPVETDDTIEFENITFSEAISSTTQYVQFYSEKFTVLSYIKPSEVKTGTKSGVVENAVFEYGTTPYFTSENVSYLKSFKIIDTDVKYIRVTAPDITDASVIRIKG